MLFARIQYKIKALLVENQIRQAMDTLMEALKGHPLEKTVLIRAAQFYKLKEEILKGTLSWEEANLEQNQINQAIIDLTQMVVDKEKSETQAFISYNREEKSSLLAKYLHDEIEAEGFNAFMDVEDISLGSDWAVSILEELKNSSYFILLLSEKANVSEMVIKEVEIAHNLRQKTGKPIILPIRVNYGMEQALNHRLFAMLKRIHQLQWHSEADNSSIKDQIMEILNGEKIPRDIPKEEIPIIAQLLHANDELRQPSPVAPLDIPRGAVRIDSKYYVPRPDEELFKKAVEQPGAVLRIRGPRQYGKTSLLTRVIAHAVKEDLDYKVVTIDFQELDEALMQDLELLLEEFCYYFAEKLDLEDEWEDHWEKAKEKKRPPKRSATRFIEKYVFKELDTAVVLALDEADRLFNYKEVSSEFFLLLRSWHERSKNVDRKEWEKFKLCLCYSTEAKLAIHDLNASPFNIGEEAKLIPFKEQEVGDLAIKHGLSLDVEQMQQLMQLLAGHPYLIRRALYLLAKGTTFNDLMDTAAQHDGPFSDHLRHHLINVRQYEECVAALKEIIRAKKCKDPLMATRLEATGLTKGNPPNIDFACELYYHYFKGKL